MEYIFEFDSIQNKRSKFRYINNATNKENFAEVFLDDNDLSYRAKSVFEPVVGDTIDLAVAIHACDRFAIQYLDREQSRIKVKLPVREPELLNAQRDKLEDLLAWATGSQWIFDFQKRISPERFIIVIRIPKIKLLVREELSLL